MTKDVLVPLDGSDKDERAITAAVAVGELTGGRLLLIRVLDTPIASLSDRARTMGVLDAARERRAELERSLAESVAQLTSSTGQPVTAEVLEAFDVARVLVDRASDAGIDIVVMATRAAGPIGRALRGSVADHVMRESPRPVLLVPPGAANVGPYKLALRRVLIPLDGSALALGALDRLLACAEGRTLEYVLVEVVRTPFSGTKLESRYDVPVEDSPATAPTVQSAKQRLEQAAARLYSGGATAIECRVIEHHDPPTGINRMAADERVDFIGMSTRGLSGFTRVMLGSVAEGVVRESNVPVLLLTATEARR